MDELWKDIEGFNGFYQISNLGRIRSKGRTKDKAGIRCISYTHDGYAKIRLMYKGVDKTVRVHRLVARAFIPNPDDKETVNHIDGDKTNNRADNLEWANRHEQLIHAYDLGLKKAKVGTSNYLAKLSDDDVKFIRKVYIPQSTKFGTVALAKKFNVTDRVIGLVVKGKSYKNVK